MTRDKNRQACRTAARKPGTSVCLALLCLCLSAHHAAAQDHHEQLTTLPTLYIETFDRQDVWFLYSTSVLNNSSTLK